MSYPGSQTNYNNRPSGQQDRTNVLAIISLISAFFISLVAVVTGHIALSQIKRTGEKGRGLAVAGLILGYLGLLSGLLIFILVVAAAGSASSNSSSLQEPSAAAPVAPAAPSSVPSQPAVEPSAAAPSVAAPSAAAPSKQAYSLAQQNAVDKAQNYLDILGFSRSGLVKQLKFDGFSTADAEFAVAHAGANWNDQAAKKAQQYLDTLSFSRKELIAQLKFDGFTTSQAEHGAAAVGY